MSVAVSTNCDARPEGKGDTATPRARRRPPSPFARDAAALVVTAACFGLATGWGEAGILLLKKHVLEQFLFLSPDFVWMAPVADGVLFTVAGLLLAGCVWLCSIRFPVEIGAALLAFAACFSLALRAGVFTLWPTLLLSAGLAVQTGRLVARRPQRFLALARRGAVGMGLAVILLVAGIYVQRHVTRQRTAAALSPAIADAPNVILIVLDTVRAQSMSLYGCENDTTPHLDEFARRGVVFERAISTSSWSLPAHATMFTGRYPHELSTAWYSPLDDTYPTLAEAFSRRGYTTVGFVANRYYCGRETGLSRGFTHYEDYQTSPGEMIRCSALGRLLADHHLVRCGLGFFDKLARKDAARINRDFLGWISRRHDQRPFFAFLNYFDAHNPYLTNCGPPLTRPDKLLMMQWEYLDKRKLDPVQVQLARAAYENSIRDLDRKLGRLFKTLDRRGVLENTLVIITSDHGEHFSEHGVFLHGTSLYRPLLHVPLLVSFPGRIPEGLRIEQGVTLRDLPATVAELMRLPRTGADSFPGRSLVRCWAPSGDEDTEPSPLLSTVRPWGRPIPDHQFAPAAKGQMWSLVSGGKHYIRRGDGVEELFDFDNDPQERKDLAGDSGLQKDLRDLRQRVQALIGP